MFRVIRGLPAAVFQGVAAFALVTLLGTTLASAQSGDLRAPDQSKSAAPAGPDASKDAQHKVDEFTEAAQAINGPAGNPECVWLGQRAVGLMLRDDLDTAFRHLDLYDRFGCPGGHIQAAFRCVTRFGVPDLKAPDTLNSRVHACWINPAAQPPQAPPTTTAATPNPASPPPQAPVQGQAPAAKP